MARRVPRIAGRGVDWLSAFLFIDPVLVCLSTASISCPLRDAVTFGGGPEAVPVFTLEFEVSRFGRGD